MENIKNLIEEIESLQKVENKIQKDLFNAKNLIQKKKKNLTILIKKKIIKKN